MPTINCHPAPIGNDWVFELKHDGYRLMVRKHEDRVRIYTRRGVDWTPRFPHIVSAIRKVKATSLLIDGEVLSTTKAGCRASRYCTRANTTRKSP